MFLESIRDGHSITAAATMAGVGRRTVYGWREVDSQFASDWDDAWESRGDWYEDQNRTQARTGNMAAILNGLKIHGRIRENVRNEHVGPGGGAVRIDARYAQMSDEEINGRIAELLGEFATGETDRSAASDRDAQAPETGTSPGND